MNEYSPDNTRDESFDRPGPDGPHSTWAQTCEWLRANGINPGDVVAKPRASMADGQVTLIMKARGPDGRDVIDPEGTGVLMETRAFPVTVPPPPLVEIWLAPKCPTCGR